MPNDSQTHEPTQDCEACGKQKPISSFGPVRVEVEVPEGVVNEKGIHGGAKVHHLYAVCKECRESSDFEAWKEKAKGQLLAVFRASQRR